MNIKIEKRAGYHCAVTSSGVIMYKSTRKVFVTEWIAANFGSVDNE